MQSSKPQLKIQNYLILSALFLLPTYLIKIKLGWVSFNALELLIGFIFVVWIFNKNTKYQIQNTRYNIPVVLIFIGLILSIIANGNYYIGLGAIKGWFIVPIIFTIIFFYSLKKDESLLKKSLLALFFSGVAISIIGVVYKFFDIVTFDGRLKTFWDSPNQLAMFLAVPFLIGCFLVQQEKESKTKRMYILSLALIGLCLYFTYSYGAWLALAVSLSTIIWLKYDKKERNKYLAIFAMLLTIFLAWASSNKYKSIENMGDRSSLASREMIWKSAGLMIEKHPIFGIGPGNFQEKYLEYQKYFPPYLEWSAPQPHNIFLAFWLESGLVGLAGFILLLIYFFRDNKKAIKKNRDLGILFLAIMIYSIVHGLVDTTYLRNDLAVVFWMVVAMNIYLSEKDQ
jgi:O-antigen ligase